MMILGKFLLLAIVSGTLGRVQIKKSPAKVLVRESRSGDHDSIEVNIRTDDELVQLQMKPASNVWKKNAQFIKMGFNELGQHTFEYVSIDKSAKIYTDASVGSVLEIDGHKVEGIVDHYRSIKFEDKTHQVYSHYGNEDDIHDYIKLPSNFMRDNSIRGQNETTTEFNPVAMPDFEIPDKLTKLRQTRETVYTIELLAVVDFELASKFDSDEDLYNYLTVFYNGVQARYTSIPSTPTILIKLVGAFISTASNNAVEPFIVNNIVTSDGNIDGDETLNSFTTWMKNSAIDRDLAYLMTARDMGYLENNSFNYNLAGIAWLRTLCLSNSTHDFSSGIGEDNGAFRGVHTAAHEIAHILGAPHDEENISGCQWEDGHIMSYDNNGPNKLTFSSCSVSDMYNILQTRECVTESNAIVTPACLGTLNKLPGQIITADEYCKRAYNDDTAYAIIEDTMCHQIRCVFGGYIHWGSTPAPVGLPCQLNGADGTCMEGVCVVPA